VDWQRHGLHRHHTEAVDVTVVALVRPDGVDNAVPQPVNSESSREAREA
jgi:hypothetical protein